MVTGILHLSDIHFKHPDQSRLVDRITSLAAAVKTRSTTLDALLVILSGDISFSGQPSEYSAAHIFTETLFAELKKEDKIQILGPVIIPGNHDCSFPENDDIRPALLNGLQTEVDGLNLSGAKVRQVLSVQDNFFEFENKYSRVIRAGSSRLYYQQEFQLSGETISVHCFNTAWVSTLPETQGRIFLPPTLRPARSVGIPELSVTIFHHPYRWFEPTRGREFQRLVETISDIVLTGHEHDGDHSRRQSSQGADVSYIEGAALNAKNIDTGFNFIIVDTKNRAYEVMKFIWKDSLYQPTPGMKNDFIRNPQLATYHLDNKVSYSTALEQLSISFPHPVKGELQVDDVFVYPDLKIRTFMDKKVRVVQSENVLDFILKEKLIHLAGSPMSGKTTLTKKLYRDLRDRHRYLPILLTGSELSGKSAKGFLSALEKTFGQQYDAVHFERYKQMASTKKALLIDDWHLSRLGTTAKQVLMEAAADEFAIVVIVSAEQIWLQDVMKAADTSNVSNFQYCDIREFGHRLRGQLITKWHNLGKEFCSAPR